MSSQGKQPFLLPQQDAELSSRQLKVSFLYCCHLSHSPHTTLSLLFDGARVRESPALETNFPLQSDLLTLFIYLNTLM